MKNNGRSKSFFFVFAVVVIAPETLRLALLFSV